jgi:hypothetical protein
MKRDALARRTPLRRGKPLARASFLHRSKPLPKVNRKRLDKRRAVEFAEQSSLVRFMCCCACAPSLYRDPQTIALEIDNARKWKALDVRPFNDAHHVVTRGSGRGRDQHCVALCREHHREIDGINSGRETFAAKYGIDPPAIAAAIHQAITKERA